MKIKSKYTPHNQWRLYNPHLGLWAGLSDSAEIIPCTSPDDPRIQLFDDMDNQTMKVKFYSSITGIAWQVQLI